MGPAGVAAIQAAGQAASSGASGLFGWISARKGRKYNERMWHQANAYNHPVEQMKRLKEAGLNPNLIYGSSAGGATGMAPPVPKHERVTPDIRIGADLGLADIMVKKAQTDNLKKQSGLISAQTVHENIKALDNLNRLPIGKAQGKIAGDMAKSQLSALQLKVKRDEQQLIMDELNAEKMSATQKYQIQRIIDEAAMAGVMLQGARHDNVVKKFHAELSKMGLTPSDKWYFRAMVQLYGGDIKRVINELPKAVGKGVVNRFNSWFFEN